MPWRRRRKHSTAELVSAVDSLHLSQQVTERTVPLWSSPPDVPDAAVADFEIFDDTSEVWQRSEHSPLFNLFPDQENVSPVASNETELREQRLNEERILTNLSMEVDGESARNHLRRRFPLHRVRLPVVSTSETVHQRAGLFSRPRSIPQVSWSEPIIFTAEIHPSWQVSWDRLFNTHAPLSKNEGLGELDGYYSKWRAKLRGMFKRNRDNRPRRRHFRNEKEPNTRNGILFQDDELHDPSSSISSHRS